MTSDATRAAATDTTRGPATDTTRGSATDATGDASADAGRATDTTGAGATDTARGPATDTAPAGYRTRLDLPSDTEIVLTRHFRAPRALVWAALTTREHVRQWYGCGLAELTTCEIDLRPGGQWHYVLTSPDGSEDSFSGEYHEVDPPVRLVATERYDNLPGAEYLTTVTLEEADGGTLFRNLLQYAAKEMRDGHVASGMEYGMNASMDALERLVLALADGSGMPASRDAGEPVS